MFGIIPSYIRIKKEYLSHSILIRNIFLIILTIIIIYFQFRYFFYYGKSLKQPEIMYSYYPHNAKQESNYILSFNRNKENDNYIFGINFFSYILDWKYRYFQKKIIYNQGEGDIIILLDSLKNDIIVKIKNLKETNDYTLKNIDINRWFNVCVVIKDLRLDIYYNGKLYATHVLTGLPKLDNHNIKLCQEGGYSGLLWNLQCYDYHLSYKMVKIISHKHPPISKKYFM